MNQQDLIRHTAEIVAAHVANNSVAIGDVGSLVRRVHETLVGLGESKQDESPEKVPIVSVRASVRPDYLVCMECGKKQKMLRRHLLTAHGMTAEQYRKDYGLPQTYPMTAPNYSARRRDLARSIGLGRTKPEQESSSDGKPKRQRAASKANGTSG